MAFGFLGDNNSGSIPRRDVTDSIMPSPFMTTIFTSKFGAISFEWMNNMELSSKTLSKSSLQTLVV